MGEVGVGKKLNFWLRGIYVTGELTPHCKAKHSGKYVFYLPHQRISSSIPFCIISNKKHLPAGYTEELIRCTLIPVTTCYGEKGVRMYLHFTGLGPHEHVNTKAVISWVYEKAMTSTFRRQGSLFLPQDNDLVVFQGSNGGRFAYTYSVFITRRNIDFSKPDLGDTFIHHKGILATTVARFAGIALSNETADHLPLPAQKLIHNNKNN